MNKPSLGAGNVAQRIKSLPRMLTARISTDLNPSCSVFD